MNLNSFKNVKKYVRNCIFAAAPDLPAFMKNSADKKMDEFLAAFEADLPGAEAFLRPLITTPSDEDYIVQAWASAHALTLGILHDEAVTLLQEIAAKRERGELTSPESEWSYTFAKKFLAREHGAKDELSAIVQALEENFGPIENMYHETAADLPLDIVSVPKTEDMPFQKLFTIGMHSKEMAVPAAFAAQELAYAELALFLKKRPAGDWPFALLKTVAAMPFQQNTWLSDHHTIDLGGPIVADHGFCGVLLLSLHGTDSELRLPDRKKVNYYLLVPLYAQEMQFARAQGVDALLDRFDERGITPVFDPDRPNCCTEPSTDAQEQADLQNGKQVARQIVRVFGQTPAIFRYGNADGSKYIDLAVSADLPSAGVCSCATIGLYRTDIGLVHGERPLRVELLAAGPSETEDFLNAVTTAAFEIMEGRAAYPGFVVQNVVGPYFPESEMRHMLLTHPFLWAGTHSFSVGDMTVAWLMCVPISENERHYCAKNGLDALESLFEKQQIDVWNLNRKSVL